jgi:hypothetical protein
MGTEIAVPDVDKPIDPVLEIVKPDSTSPPVLATDSTSKYRSKRSRPSLASHGITIQSIESARIEPITTNAHPNATGSSKDSTYIKRSAVRFPEYPPDVLELRTKEYSKEFVTVELIQQAQQLIEARRRADQFVGNTKPGTLDHYAALVFAAGITWHIDPPIELFNRWRLIAQSYDTAWPIFLLNSFHVAKSLPVISPWGPSLSDQVLAHGHALLAQGDVHAARQLWDAMDLPSTSTHRKEDDAVVQWQKLLDSCERDQAKIQSLGSIESTNPAEHSLAGKYLCLINRRWKEGLPWLAQGSDRSLAKLAAQELGQTTGSEAELGDLANQWQRTEKQLPPYLAPLALLHAIELLEQATKDSAIRELRFGADLKALQSRLPIWIAKSRSLVEAMRSIEAESTSVLETEAVNPLATNVRKSFEIPMRGTARRSEFSVPIDLRYSTGDTITAEQLSGAPDAWVTIMMPLQIFLEGSFDIEQETELHIRWRGSSQDKRQTVYLDDQCISDNPASTDVSIRVPAGKHRLVWFVQTHPIDDLRLQVNR